MIYLITYDLNKEGANYWNKHKQVCDTIMAAPDHCHALESVWLVDTPRNAKEIFDIIAQYLDSNDRLWVSQVTPEHYGFIHEPAASWLARHFS